MNDTKGGLGERVSPIGAPTTKNSHPVSVSSVQCICPYAPSVRSALPVPFPFLVDG